MRTSANGGIFVNAGARAERTLSTLKYCRQLSDGTSSDRPMRMPSRPVASTNSWPSTRSDPSMMSAAIDPVSSRSTNPFCAWYILTPKFAAIDLR
jgi:hypothetical protein